MEGISNHAYFSITTPGRIVYDIFFYYYSYTFSPFHLPNWLILLSYIAFRMMLPLIQFIL